MQEKRRRKATRMCKIKTHTFGEAIEAVKKGAKISRLGWNGKEQWVEMGKCFSYSNTKGELVNATHEDIMDRALVFVGIRGIQVGWLASQADMLAEDWLIGYDY